MIILERMSQYTILNEAILKKIEGAADKRRAMVEYVRSIEVPTGGRYGKMGRDELRRNAPAWERLWKDANALTPEIRSDRRSFYYDFVLLQIATSRLMNLWGGELFRAFDAISCRVLRRSRRPPGESQRLCPGAGRMPRPRRARQMERLVRRRPALPVDQPHVGFPLRARTGRRNRNDPHAPCMERTALNTTAHETTLTAAPRRPLRRMRHRKPARRPEGRRADIAAATDSRQPRLTWTLPQSAETPVMQTAYHVQASSAEGISRARPLGQRRSRRHANRLHLRR